MQQVFIIAYHKAITIIVEISSTWRCDLFDDIMFLKHQGIPRHAQRRQNLKMIEKQLKMPIYLLHNSSNDKIEQTINAYPITT